MECYRCGKGLTGEYDEKCDCYSNLTDDCISTTFEDARVGEKVWSFMHGFGEIVVSDKKMQNEIHVKFTTDWNETFIDYYSFGGVHYQRTNFRELYWDKIKFDVPKRPC